MNLEVLSSQIKLWGAELGFQQIGIADIDLSNHQKGFLDWLNERFHGEMFFMEKHGEKRLFPEKLVPGTIRIISARLNYFPENANSIEILNQSDKAYISRYALGRDYHKVMRAKLKTLAEKISMQIQNHSYRVFSDSAPVLEIPLAEKAGLGWRGKNTLLLNKEAGSYFFLGEIFTNIPLPIDLSKNKNHCGTCTACLDDCPTKAIVAPYQLDARRCISYLTIELGGSIPIEFRPLMGNRIYGCDDCQLCCPWNRFAKNTEEVDFFARKDLLAPTLLSLFAWDETTFLKRMEGSAIRRIGHVRWLRNIAVALGNADYSQDIISALKDKLNFPNEIVKEHVLWALDRQIQKSMIE